MTNEQLAADMAENLLARMRKTASGEIVAFDKLHVTEVLLATVDQITQERDRIDAARDEDNPAAQALDDLWKAIVLARDPNYGDWEYPGQAYRHLVCEFDDMRKAKDRAEAALAVLTQERTI
jgi:hypothetical protein